MISHLREFIADVLMALLCGCIIVGTLIGTEVILAVVSAYYHN